MLNFIVKGKYTSEDELINVDGAVQFREGDSLQDAFVKGVLIGLPLFAIMIISMIFRLRNINMKLEMNLQTGIILAAAILILPVLTYVHEMIHGIFYPFHAVKTIGRTPKQDAFFVHCDAPVCKMRFVAICIAPAVILGILPFAALLIFAEPIPAACAVAIWIVSLVMTVGAIGDFANIYNTIRQVHKGAKVFNYGMHSYWIR